MDSPAVFEILTSKRIGVTSLTFRGYIRHRSRHSRDRFISHRPFSIGSPLEPSQALSLMVSEIFNGECDTVVDMTLNDIY